MYREQALVVRCLAHGSSRSSNVPFKNLVFPDATPSTGDQENHRSTGLSSNTIEAYGWWSAGHVIMSI